MEIFINHVTRIVWLSASKSRFPRSTKDYRATGKDR